MINIVFLDAATMGEDLSFDAFNELGNFTLYQTTSVGEVNERIKDAEVVILNKIKFGKENIDSAPKLKLICEAATGMDNIDVVYARSKGIEVRNAAGYSTDSVAQLTFGHILALTNHLPYFNDYVHAGEYIKSPSPVHYGGNYRRDISQLTIGIIGLGNIGRKVATIAKAFGMEVVYYSTSGKNDNSEYKRLSLEELLRTADVVSIHAPMNGNTRNLINASNIKLMKPSAIIVNMGRGGIVNEQDLVDALNNGVIAGAGIDVFSKEPTPADHPYYQLKDKSKMFLTPHIGWTSDKARTKLVEMIIDNIKTFYK